MHPALVVALGFRYPSPGHEAELAGALESLSQGPARRRMSQFVDEVAHLDLGEWEELHTRTLDLSPLFVPYVGHVAWGENYRRGAFMADLKREMDDAGLDLRGELPDHIEPVLRYVATGRQPLPDLLDVLPGAVSAMQRTLEAAERANPYRHLVAATVAVVQDLNPVVIGAGR